MRKRAIFFILIFCAFTVQAQNITDLSVMNSKDKGGRMWNIEATPAIADSVFLHPDRVRYDHRCLQIEGKDVFIFSGSFHYFRVPKPLWTDRFAKLKAAGFNCVETYVPWNWHERTMPSSFNDYSVVDMSELDAFLSMAEDYGFYVVLRPGPYICAEWSGGGFPQWIMRKKLAKTAFEVWLQSNDPEFVRWSEYWYNAVCRTAKSHQITQKGKGGKGIILFQIENEYDRVSWFTHQEKKSYLESLAISARRNGIDVPLITCWTDESRNVGMGALNGVVDMVNSYPRWQIERNFGRLIDLQMKTQPGKPLISGELQGGWCCELGWQLSWNQDGLPPVQTQNITLYALQRGFCTLNFYMAVGGTNFDDWAARQQITSYDYAAAIGEDGNTNERYRRFCGLGSFLSEHGTRIARADLAPLDYTSTDSAVKLALRTEANGDRYYFVRTEEHTKQHFGTLRTGDGLKIDFAIEPFGSMVYYLPNGKDYGEWFPKLPEPQVKRTETQRKTDIRKIEEWNDVVPKKWTRLVEGRTIDDYGVYGRHFIYLKTKAKVGGTLEIGRIGRGVVNNSMADTVLVSVERKLVPIASETGDNATYRLPGDSLKDHEVDVLMLFESKGLHHHTNRAVEKYWRNGPTYVRCNGKDLPLQFACTEKRTGEKQSVSAGKSMKAKSASVAEPMLKWYKYVFDTPDGEASTLHLRLEQCGNGFVYVNRRCIGRCWKQGPQREYYIPECWLNKGKPNVVVVSLRPTVHGATIKDISIKTTN